MDFRPVNTHEQRCSSRQYCIRGDNSTTITINVTVSSPQTASISFSNTTIYNIATQGILTEERGVNETTCNQNGSVWDSANGLYISKSRNLLIINNGPDVAKNVTYTISPSLPAGTTIMPASCGDIVPNGVCTLTVTPGTTPTSPSGTQPTPSIITASGINTPTPASAQITVLTYGNIYQGLGYLFAIDDAASFMGGKITALNDQNQETRWGTMGYDSSSVGTGCVSIHTP